MPRYVAIKLLIIPLLAAGILLMGCCGPTSSGTSGSCPYGTYGQACTEFCDKSAGTQFDEGPNCFSECIYIVKQQGLGDATTCCKENIRQGCTRVCQEQIGRMKSTYGPEAVNEEMQDFMSECTGECITPYTAMGIDIDSTCNLIDLSQYAQTGWED
ncbi:MAG: hypothetical protein QXU54_03685 [Candidatus Micrarchaeia archaeon]